MRGRSLLREPTSTSLCAFCAHRLGASRRPASNIQRRFLQSSRKATSSPAAATSQRESDGDRGPAHNTRPAPAWGQSGRNEGFGSTAPWAQPAFGGGEKPVTPDWGQSNGTFGVSSESQASTHSIPQPAVDDLLPHERRARENMLRSEEEAQRRKPRIHSGAGPQHTRAGRPLPLNGEEKQELARQTFNKTRSRERKDEPETNTGGFSLRRMYIRDPVNMEESSPRRNDSPRELPRWSQLRRRDESHPSEMARSPNSTEADHFTTGRARREEEAKLGRYVPLIGRAELQNVSHSIPKGTNGTNGRSTAQMDTGRPRDSTSTGKYDQKWPRSLQEDRFPDSRESRDVRFSRGSKGSAWGDEHRFGISHPSDRNSTSSTTQDDRAYTRTHRESTDSAGTRQELGSRPSPISQRLIPERTVSHQPMMPSQPEQPKMKAGEALEIEKSDDLDDRRRRPGRFTEKSTPSYQEVPKGKSRDKARRREQFVEEYEDDEEAQRSAKERAELKKRRKAEKAALKAAAPVPIILPEYITISNLAVALKVRLEDFVGKLEELGFEETNHDYILNGENAGLIAMEYNFEAIIDKGDSEDLKARDPAPDPSILPQRPPVVTIMGHVDHGKTTLLDWLRKSSVAATEHGGITQHIGAFSVPMPSGKIITFLDTPGHAAFLSMRQRGANVTDIVILVVAADDSVKPQTIEAIKHAQAAKVPIIVAINKIDKEESNIDRVKQDLARHGLDVEDFGGETQAVCVSGKTGQGMGELEEAAVTLSEILDMRAETDGPAEGWVLEASIKSMGKVATILVRRGTMRPGDFIVAGKTWARIRCLRNEAGVEIEEAGPGTPVEIDGWREQPLAGDEVLQAPDEAKAKSVVDYRLEKEERELLAQDMEAINENRKAEQEKRAREKAEAAAAAEALANDEEILAKPREQSRGTKEIYFIVKGDVSGSVEAVVESISAIGNQEVRPHILRSGVGQLSEFDIEHAAVAKGVLINFNTTVEPNIAQLAAHSKVPILDHNIIYRLVDDVKAELSKHLPPLVTYKVLGEAEIAEIFQITVKGRKQKPIAGSKVRNGTISKSAKVRVLRNGEKIFDGTLVSLKNVKKDIMEMKKGGECGISFDGWFDFQVGDHVQSYEEISEKRYL